MVPSRRRAGRTGWQGQNKASDWMRQPLIPTKHAETARFVNSRPQVRACTEEEVRTHQDHKAACELTSMHRVPGRSYLPDRSRHVGGVCHPPRFAESIRPERWRLFARE